MTDLPPTETPDPEPPPVPQPPDLDTVIQDSMRYIRNHTAGWEYAFEIDVYTGVRDALDALIAAVHKAQGANK